MISRHKTILLAGALFSTYALTVADAFAQNALQSNVSAQKFEAIRGELDDEARRAALTEEEWKAFGERLSASLESDNEGVRRGALRLAAYYGDKLQMGHSAAISAVRIYRDHPDPYMRKMAVVAIARLNNPWGIDFLTRSLEYEDSTDIARTMRHALEERSSSGDQ